MELKEYIKIIKKNFTLYLVVILLIVFGTLIYFAVRPVSYDTSLFLNISRLGTQETIEYKYDDFYRLQADEKFAETVVEWLKSPRTAVDIYTESEIDTTKMNLRQLSKSISSEKRSSQIISVNFSAPDQKTAEKISASVTKIISQNTQNLNKNQKENTWFEIVPQDSVIKKYNPGILVALVLPLLLGLFLGFWVIMIKHYIE